MPDKFSQKKIENLIGKCGAADEKCEFTGTLKQLAENKVNFVHTALKHLTMRVSLKNILTMRIRLTRQVTKSSQVKFMTFFKFNDLTFLFSHKSVKT